MPLFRAKGSGDAITQVKEEQNIFSQDSLFTEGLCRALIIKKEVSPQRFKDFGADSLLATCPRECHVCCKIDVTLDLTAVESLMVYLLNRDIVNLIDEYIALHDPTGYCPFMIMGRSVINHYKPSACQMFMPFDFQGKAVCFYLVDDESTEQFIGSTACTMHSNSYAVHGFMLEIQEELAKYLSHTSFKNIYEGTAWWRMHYDNLPQETKVGLESIINEDIAGLQRLGAFNFEKSLDVGFRRYNDKIEQHEKDVPSRHPA